jgi:hypothetical protein
MTTIATASRGRELHEGAERQQESGNNRRERQHEEQPCGTRAHARGWTTVSNASERSSRTSVVPAMKNCSSSASRPMMLSPEVVNASSPRIPAVAVMTAPMRSARQVGTLR